MLDIEKSWLRGLGRGSDHDFLGGGLGRVLPGTHTEGGKRSDTKVVISIVFNPRGGFVNNLLD